MQSQLRVRFNSQWHQRYSWQSDLSCLCQSASLSSSSLPALSNGYLRQALYFLGLNLRAFGSLHQQRATVSKRNSLWVPHLDLTG